MKKILSVIIAIVMVAMCMPVAYAVEASVVDEAVEAFCDFMTYSSNIYSTAEENDTVIAVYEEVGKKLSENGYIFYMVREYIEAYPEAVAPSAAIINEANLKIEKLIDNGEVTVVVDTSVVMHLYCRIFAYHYQQEVDEAISDADEEYLNKFNDSMDAIDAFMQKGYENPASVSQEEYEATVADFYDFLFMLNNCLEKKHNLISGTDLSDGTHIGTCVFCGETDIVEAHTWGEYIPDANGKTAKCEKCDATDTVEGEWVELPAEDNSNFFTNIIAKIKGFFENLINFFKNLFA